MSGGGKAHSAPSLNVKETEFTQWRSSAGEDVRFGCLISQEHSLGVLNPSPLKTCPR